MCRVRIGWEEGIYVKMDRSCPVSGIFPLDCWPGLVMAWQAGIGTAASQWENRYLLIIKCTCIFVIYHFTFL